ncbi:MAG: hypothetical protein AAGA96_19225 [Verrucomicrobiota bacterium]
MTTFDGTSLPLGYTNSASIGDPWNFGGTPGYNVSPVADQTGNGGFFAWVDFSGNNLAVTLTAPIVDITSVSNPSLSFWTVSHAAGLGLTTYNFLFIEASDGLGNWQNVATLQGETGFDWAWNSYDLTPFVYDSNFVQIRFRGESGGSGPDFYNDLLLDDIRIGTPVPVPEPSTITLVSSLMLLSARRSRRPPYKALLP